MTFAAKCIIKRTTSTFPFDIYARNYRHLLNVKTKQKQKNRSVIMYIFPLNYKWWFVYLSSQDEMTSHAIDMVKSVNIMLIYRFINIYYPSIPFFNDMVFWCLHKCTCLGCAFFIAIMVFVHSLQGKSIISDDNERLRNYNLPDLFECIERITVSEDIKHFTSVDAS